MSLYKVVNSSGKVLFDINDSGHTVKGSNKIAEMLYEELDCKITRNNTKQDNSISKGIQFGTVAAATDIEKPVFSAKSKCIVTELVLTNELALAIDATNFTKLELINKGSDGTGTTVLATFDQATEAFVAFVALSKTVADIILNQGDVLALKKTDTLSGGVITNLLVEVNHKPF